MKPYIVSLRILSLLAFLISTLSLRGTEDIRELTFSYRADTRDLIHIDNSLGSIQVTPWEQPHVNMVVKIKVTGEDAKEVEETLQRIDIQSYQEEGIITGRTVLNNIPHKDFSKKVMIDYLIRVPITCSVSLHQEYGKIYIQGNMEGESKIRLRFGSLQASSFMSPIELEAEFSSIDISHITKGTVKLHHCRESQIDSAKDLDLESEFSPVNSRNIDRLRLYLRHGNCRFGQIRQLKIDAIFGDILIGSLEHKMEATSFLHSALQVDHLEKNFRLFEGVSEFSRIRVGIPANSSFRMKALMRFGSIDCQEFTPLKDIIPQHQNHRTILNTSVNGKKSKALFWINGSHSELIVDEYSAPNTTEVIL